MDTERLAKQIQFILEIDRFKQVLRRNPLADRTRLENDAEHSWHLAVMALILSEHAVSAGLDLARVVRMLLIHDVVEIDAGDVYIYDSAAMAVKAEREERAAERLFGLLPVDQGAELRTLWEEFERRETPEARFAAALDRLQPLLLNYHTGGESWRRHGITSEQVLAVNQRIAAGSGTLWEYARSLIENAVQQGFFSAEPAGPVEEKRQD